MLNWSEDQAAPVDSEDLELLNKDFVNLIQFAKAIKKILWALNSVIVHDYIHMAWEWLHMTVLRENMLSRQQPLQGKMQLLLRSESENCLAKCLGRVNIIFTCFKCIPNLSGENCDESILHKSMLSWIYHKFNEQ